MNFSHLHVHTQFSLLDGASKIKRLYEKAICDNMPAVAITDHGNMFGVFQFVAEAHRHTITLPDGRKSPKVKPVVGCEFYIVEDRYKKNFTKQLKDKRYHQLLLAKNDNGYKNLMRLCSLGYIEGLYSKYPRIDKELVLKYHKDLIATTCCLGALVPQMILEKGEKEAEKEFLWWLDLFGEDYYIELQRHDLPSQNIVNEVLLKWAKKHQVKYFASNDVHYTEQKDSLPHDILLCINTGEKLSTPKQNDLMDADDISSKNSRFSFPNDNFFFKTTEEMHLSFKDIPQALDTTNEMIDKVEVLNLKRDILLPNFSIPNEFTNQFEYLKHLTYQGARKRYFELTDSIENRIKFELDIIQKMGYPGYFLIVQDFILAAQEMNVLVGPGRGSAAGSIVAYCLGITTLDPLKYGLLFERFLNPDRRTLPDIDVDFDDEGRVKVIDYIVQKYGKNQVAQIVNYGSLKARSSIKDVARVMDLSLQDSAYLSNLVPERQTLTIRLDRLLEAPLEGENSLQQKEELSSEEMDRVKTLRKFYQNENALQGKVLKNAISLEGSVRNTGIHAAGIIIAPKDLLDIIPVCTSKDTDLLVTQIDGKDIENAGVIKMDVLSIKTLTIIKKAQDFIKQWSNAEFDIQKIPLDDIKTFKLFQQGETIGVFQFESQGMQKYLKELKPDRFEDLIAMNALYRPGPMGYIPSYINRKFGREDVKYDFKEVEETLKETYGITVYQEQVMMLSQKLAGFSRGDSDILRKAMGKKDRKTLDEMKEKFVSGSKKNGFDQEIIEKIWKDWESFASYAFNKSHSTVYALVAYQTAYLKANYPHEFFTSLLLSVKDSIDKINFFTNEARRLGIEILGPDVIESNVGFSLNDKKQIRYGLEAIKGMGTQVCQAIIDERKKGGFKTLGEMLLKLNKKVMNKKVLESLSYSGALDCFKEFHRAQYFHIQEGTQNMTGVERILKDWSILLRDKENSLQQNLFSSLPKEKDDYNWVQVDSCPKWTLIEQLKHEKNITGSYLSGHPLDNFAFEYKFLKMNLIQELNEVIKRAEENHNMSFSLFRIGGIITKANHFVSKKGTKYAKFVLEDFSGSIELAMFTEKYMRFSKFVVEDTYVLAEVALRKFGHQNFLSPQISQMYLLDSIRDIMCKNLEIILSPQNVDNKLIDVLKSQFKKPAGNSYIKIGLYDEKSKSVIQLTNKQKPIMIDDEFADFLIRQENFLVKIS